MDLEDVVLEGDCLDLLKSVPSKSIRLVLADLPYGATANPWARLIDLELLWEQYKRVVVDNGVIALTGQGLFTGMLIMSNPQWFKYKVVWIKSVATNYLNAVKQPLRKHEDICIFYNKQPVYHPQKNHSSPYTAKRKQVPSSNYGEHKSTPTTSGGMRYPTDVLYHEEDHWTINTAMAEGKIYHPTQKPLGIGRRLIRTYSNEGELVLDNACGAGSFLVSAVLENRRFIGMEKNEQAYLFGRPVDLVAICRQRIADAKKQYHAALLQGKLF